MGLRDSSYIMEKRLNNIHILLRTLSDGRFTLSFCVVIRVEFVYYHICKGANCSVGNRNSGMKHLNLLQNLFELRFRKMGLTLISTFSCKSYLKIR